MGPQDTGHRTTVHIISSFLITRFADTYGTVSTESTVTYKYDLVLLMGRKPQDSNIGV